MRVAVIINKTAGTAPSSQDIMTRLKDNFSLYKIDTEIYTPEANKIKELTESVLQADFDIIAAAGGDGTLNSVASLLAGTGKPMGIIPLGTLNHFAKDLGIPLELENSIRIISEGNPQMVDIGSVNGHIFINNSSVDYIRKQ